MDMEVAYTGWNETMSQFTVQSGSTPTSGPGFWRTNKFVPGIPTTLTETIWMA